jgi:hypothetical protein
MTTDTTTKLIDELAAMLVSMPDDGDAMPDTLTPPSASVTQAAELASPQPESTAEVIELADARVRADARKAAREAMTDEAMHAAIDALQIIRKTFTENGADFDDACKALPLVHKVLEHVDRMEAGVKDVKNLPVLNFTIVLDDSVPQEAPPRRKRTLQVGPAPQIVDAVEIAPDTIDLQDLGT